MIIHRNKQVSGPSSCSRELIETDKKNNSDRTSDTSFCCTNEPFGGRLCVSRVHELPISKAMSVTVCSAVHVPFDNFPFKLQRQVHFAGLLVNQVSVSGTMGAVPGIWSGKVECVIIPFVWLLLPVHRQNIMLSRQTIATVQDDICSHAPRLVLGTLLLCILFVMFKNSRSTALVPFHSGDWIFGHTFLLPKVRPWERLWEWGNQHGVVLSYVV